MHFPPVKNLCLAVSGKSTKCAPGHSDERAHFRRKNRRSPPRGSPAAHAFTRAQRRERPPRFCPPPCNSPASRRGADGSSSASYLLRRVLPMADFRPGGQGRFGAFLRPQCRSRGVSDPVSFRLPPDPHRGLCSGQPHSILGHDSLSGPVSPQSHSYHTRFSRKSQRSAPCKTAVYCRTAKNRRSGAESPCFAGKKDV